VPGSGDEADATEAEYRPLLFSIAYGMTGSVGDGEDIVQDAFFGLTRVTAHVRPRSQAARARRPVPFIAYPARGPAASLVASR